MRRVNRMARLARLRRAFVDRARQNLAVALAVESRREHEYADVGEAVGRAGQVDAGWTSTVWKMRELTLARAGERLHAAANRYAGAAAETRMRREELLDAVRHRDAFVRLHERLARAAAQQEQVRSQQHEDEMYRLAAPAGRRRENTPEES